MYTYYEHFFEAPCNLPIATVLIFSLNLALYNNYYILVFSYIFCVYEHVCNSSFLSVALHKIVYQFIAECACVYMYIHVCVSKI